MKDLLRAILIVALFYSPALARESYPAVNPNITCPGECVVWVNTNSGIYHYEGERWFGRTSDGEFEREKQAEREGDRATENGQ
jgi:hypothetical protein